MFGKNFFANIKAMREKETVQNEDAIMFLELVKNRQYNKVCHYLKNGINVDVCDDYEGTALNIACNNEDFTMIKLLIKNGANPNLLGGGSCPNSALHISIEKGNVHIVKFLLENSVNIALEQKNGANEYPLSIALSVLEDKYSDSNKEILKLMLEHGASPNIKDANGVFLLEKACLIEKLDIVKLLLEYGADVDFTTINGGSILDLACCIRNSDISKLLLSYGAFSHRVPLQRLKQLCPKSISDKDISSIPDNEMDVIQFKRAVEEGRYDKVSLFVEQGININNKSSFEDNILNLACKNDDIRMVQLLLEQGANPNIRGMFNETPLTTAIQHKCDINIIKLLLEYGANPNVRNIFLGDPILNEVCYWGKMDMAKLLLEHGANPNVQGMLGMTALEMLSNKNSEIAKLLLENGANPNKLNVTGETMLHVACINNDVQSVDMLLKYNANINEKNYNEELPLHVACKFGNEKVVDTLIKAYKNAESAYSLLEYYNSVSKDNKTPLQLARDNKNKVIQERLQDINKNAIVQCILSNKFSRVSKQWGV